MASLRLHHDLATAVSKLIVSSDHGLSCRSHELNGFDASPVMGAVEWFDIPVLLALAITITNAPCMQF